MQAAEELTKMSHQQVSKWRKRLKVRAAPTFFVPCLKLLNTEENANAYDSDQKKTTLGEIAGQLRDHTRGQSGAAPGSHRRVRV